MKRTRIREVQRRWDSSTRQFVAVSESESHQHFLKGPVPIWWLRRAGKLGRVPLVVGLAIWFRSGVTKSQSVSLSNTALKPWGVDRYGKYRALKALRTANLIRVRQHGSQSPIVEIVLDPEEQA